MGEIVHTKRTNGRAIALAEVQTRFNISETVKQLQFMMKEVTKKEISADTVNAACNCISGLNLTIKTAISAARFLSEVKEPDENVY